MTSAVCSNSDELQRRRRRRFCQRRQMVFNALAVCSMVRSGFFPPKLVGLLGDEQQGQLAEDQVPQQSLPTSAFEVPEADLGLGQAEGVLDVPAAERHLQQREQLGLG